MTVSECLILSTKRSCMSKVRIELNIEDETDKKYFIQREREYEEKDNISTYIIRF